MKNEYTTTKELMMARAKDFYLYRTSDVIWFALWTILAIITIYFTNLLVLLSGQPSVLFFGFVMFLLCLYKLFFERLVIMSRRYKYLAKTYGVDKWISSVEFLNNEIIVTEHIKKESYQYENITQFTERKDYVVILINNSTGIIVYKNAFLNGSWEECKTLINSKMKK